MDRLAQGTGIGSLDLPRWHERAVQQSITGEDAAAGGLTDCMMDVCTQVSIQERDLHFFQQTSVTLVRCGKGAIHVQLQFSVDLPPKYTGVWDGAPIYTRSHHLFHHYNFFTAQCLLRGFLPRCQSNSSIFSGNGLVVRWANSLKGDKSTRFCLMTL
jgi:hypothetical protein